MLATVQIPDFDENAQRTPVPQFALIFHGLHRQALYGGSRDDSAFVTRHTIFNREDGPLIGPGEVMSDGDCESVVGALRNVQSHARQGLTVLAANILAQAPGAMAWWVKGAVRPMWFNLEGRQRRLDVIWPHLLFVAREGGLAVAALKSARRPEATTPLYHAPLMNVFQPGHVCLGSATIPRVVEPAACDAFEAAIFDTNFSHVNHGATLCLGEDEVGNQAHFRFYRRLAKEKATRFPSKALVPLNRTLEQFLHAHAGAGR